MDPIEVMIKEYETLREEILATMHVRSSILSFGLATIGAIITASIAVSVSGSYSPLSNLMLILGVPAVSNFVLFMWLGEYQRMQRAGRFLVDLERRVNDKAEENLLTWETHLREQSRHLKYPYHTTVLLFMAISVISLVAGLITFGLFTAWIWILAAAGIILHLAVYRYVTSSIARMVR